MRLTDLPPATLPATPVAPPAQGAAAISAPSMPGDTVTAEFAAMMAAPDKAPVPASTTVAATAATSPAEAETGDAVGDAGETMGAEDEAAAQAADGARKVEPPLIPPWFAAAQANMPPPAPVAPPVSGAAPEPDGMQDPAASMAPESQVAAAAGPADDVSPGNGEPLPVRRGKDASPESPRSGPDAPAGAAPHGASLVAEPNGEDGPLPMQSLHSPPLPTAGMPLREIAPPAPEAESVTVSAAETTLGFRPAAAAVGIAIPFALSMSIEPGDRRGREVARDDSGEPWAADAPEGFSALTLANGLTNTATVTAAPETLRAQFRPMAVALAAHPGQTVELLLAPEELGRVRLVLNPAEGGISVRIAADRPETLDLLRRHSGELAQDLAALGFEGATFTFGGEDRPAHDGAAPFAIGDPAGFGGPPPGFVTAALVSTPPTRMSAGGLDLRL